MSTRREVLGVVLGAVAARPILAADLKHASATATACVDSLPINWGQGYENQRKADLGDGKYLNPIIAGDYPDPSIVRNGEDFYMTHSSFDASPGLLIWHSRDLVNWTPVGPALDKPLGTVFAVDLVKHDGRFYIYIPFIQAPWSKGFASFAGIYVIHAERIEGPWSEPIDLRINGLIDPCHVVGEDGRRYLFLSGVNRVRLSLDGLSTDGEVSKVYDGWKYPDEWITEAFSLEGPKLVRRGEWFYLVGGTGGPPTGHMVIAARSKSIHGPWQNCPHNPLVRTKGKTERWWSRGHATLFEGPGGAWNLVYHGYENGYRTLGRQTLLDPVTWSVDGWPHPQGGDLSMPLNIPNNTRAGPHGMPRSDDFSKSTLGTRWSFYSAAPSEAKRFVIGGDSLAIAGKGSGPHDCSPLTQQVGDHAYEISVEMELSGAAEGGLLLFFDDRLFLGMGHNGLKMTTYRGGKSSYWQEPAPATRKLQLKIVNEHNIVTFYYRSNDQSWTRHGVRSETSGYEANTMDDLSSLRPALFAAGSGTVYFRNFRYRALAA